MIIAGAGGHGKEVRHVLIQQGFSISEIFFFDEDPAKLIGSGVVTVEEVVAHFNKDPRFVLGVGNSGFREKLYNLLSALGGSLYGVTNHHTPPFENFTHSFDEMPFTFIGPDTKIGLGVLVNTRAHIHHDCEVGEFSEIGPGAMLLGGSKIGKHCSIGAGAIILPKVELGDQVIVGAGAVVTKSVFKPTLLKGIPAR